MYFFLFSLRGTSSIYIMESKLIFRNQNTPDLCLICAINIINLCGYNIIINIIINNYIIIIQLSIKSVKLQR